MLTVKLLINFLINRFTWFRSIEPYNEAHEVDDNTIQDPAVLGSRKRTSSDVCNAEKSYVKKNSLDSFSWKQIGSELVSCS